MSQRALNIQLSNYILHIVSTSRAKEPDEREKRDECESFSFFAHLLHRQRPKPILGENDRIDAGAV